MNNSSFEDKSIDSAFARFNTILTSLKALDEGYSSKNYVRKFLRALHLKWREKVMEIEESKHLTSLSLDELIGNLKVHEMIIKKDFEIVKAKRERKSLAWLKRNLVMKKVRLSEVKTKNSNYLIEECPKPPRYLYQKAFVEGSWSDSGKEDDEKAKDETCLMDHASSESTRSLNEMLGIQKPSGDKPGLGFNSFEASTSGTKKTEFMKSKDETSHVGGPLISDGGSYKVETAPKAN
ncbi:hypothetical protein Tco_0351465 [Tanacetum coccineum]